MDSRMFSPGPTPNTVRAADGSVLTAPEGWVLLPPGDAALTRRVKEAGDHWVVAEKKGRKVFSKGVWASAATIDRIVLNSKVSVPLRVSPNARKPMLADVCRPRPSTSKISWGLWSAFWPFRRITLILATELH